MTSQGPELGQMLSLLSHELRSPLGVVRGYLRLLNQHQGELSDTHRQAVAAALKASDRCVDLLVQASALAQMWRQEAAIARQPLTIADLLQPLAATVRKTDGQPLPLEVDAAIAVSISGDLALLQTAISSLASAVHRAQPDEVTLSIAARLEPSDEQDGVAIAMVPRGQSTDKASETPLDLRRGGLGLDLPMAAAIVAAHGGTIGERRSHEGRMAVVVWLPLFNEERKTKNEERERRT